MGNPKVRERDFNLHTWFATIPMTDDVYLGMQAQNIARVEMAVLRLWESYVLDEQRADPGDVQGPKYRELMALSQMWVFGLYEILRTWRERAKKLMDFEDELKKFPTQAERDAYLAMIIVEAKESAKHVDQLPVYYPDHVAKIVDSDFMRSVRDYYANMRDLWQELGAVRIAAAKHQLPGKRGVLAPAPGISLPSQYTGSMCWQVLVGNKQEKRTIERRDLADRFLGILGWHEDAETAFALAKADKARRNRLRQEARRQAAKTGTQDPLDEFFRTGREKDFDDKEPYFVKKPAYASARKEKKAALPEEGRQRRMKRRRKRSRA
jgi:hypothetical protein